jgi:hypothetical protein
MKEKSIIFQLKVIFLLKYLVMSGFFRIFAAANINLNKN